MNSKHDAIGAAIKAFKQGQKTAEIIVSSDLCEDDIIPVKYLFRTYDEMDAIEQMAINLSHGKILDVGGGAGCHAIILNKKNKVISIDTSFGAVEHMKEINLDAIHSDILSFNENEFDTIILLMNGLGIAGTIDKLPSFLLKLKSLLKPDGKILCDSTDILYLFQNEDGSFDINLNSNYYGEMKFQMKFEDSKTPWFDWLYIDSDNLDQIANKVGLSCEIVLQDESNHYLAELKIMH